MRSDYESHLVEIPSHLCHNLFDECKLVDVVPRLCRRSSKLTKNLAVLGCCRVLPPAVDAPSHFTSADDTRADMNGESYYRLHGPSLVMEHALQDKQGGYKLHVHAVMRDLGNDYAKQLV